MTNDERGGSRPTVGKARQHRFGSQDRLYHLHDRILGSPVGDAFGDRRLHQMVPDGHPVLPLASDRHEELIKLVDTGVGRKRIFDDGDGCRLVVIVRLYLSPVNCMLVD